MVGNVFVLQFYLSDFHQKNRWRSGRYIYLDPLCPDGKTVLNINLKESITDGGRVCQNWNVDEPHEHINLTSQFMGTEEAEESSNFCRRVLHDKELPWCFTMDPYMRFQYCAERICGGPVCGGVWSEAPGLLHFVGADNWFYSTEKDCLWTLLAPDNMYIHIELVHLELYCYDAHLEIYESSSDAGGASFFHGAFCKYDDLDSNITSLSNTLYLRYNRYDIQRRETDGFIANITFVSFCGNDEFACDDHTCIADKFRCDGKFSDCQGGEDEENCGTMKTISTTLTTTLTEETTLSGCKMIMDVVVVTWALSSASVMLIAARAL